MRSERALRAAARDHTAARLSPDLAAAYLNGLGETGIELGADQAAAVRGVLTSGADRRVPGRPGRHRQVLRRRRAQPRLDRPRPLADGQQRRVVGLAASQIATNVLADEGLTARNITRWLATQQRLADGGTHPRRPGLAARPR